MPLVENWSKKKCLPLEGYVSTTRDLKLAKKFANLGQLRDENNAAVVLYISMDNKNSKYFINLDRPDYTNYP